MTSLSCAYVTEKSRVKDPKLRPQCQAMQTMSRLKPHVEVLPSRTPIYEVCRETLKLGMYDE